MNNIKVLIADDHAIVRDGIRQLLKKEPDIEVVGEAIDGIQAIEKVKDLNPHVVLLDIAMPNLNGLEVIEILRESTPQSRIVILSMHANESYVHQVLKSGALGYVLKASPSTDIVDAIRAAHNKEYFLSSKIKASVIDSYLKTKKNEPATRGYDLLSEREQQVFRLIVQGSSTKQIAKILFVSPKTIEKHRSSISAKLNIHGRLEMLKYAIKIGIVNPELWDY
jgi:two-component system, NarL family, response regulator NreC